VACFNTLRNSLLLLDEEVYIALQNKRLDLLDKATTDLLETNGIVLESSIDEFCLYKYLRNKKIFDTSHFYVFLTLTTACNCACRYCFQADRKVRKNEYLSEKASLKIRNFITNNIKKYGSKSLQVDFFGGEPFLYFKMLKNEIEFYNKWAMLNNIKVSFRIYTNGTILNQEMADFLSEQPISDLQITLDGPKRIHDANRPLLNGKSSFELILRNLLSLKKRLVPFILRINFDKNSVNYYEELLNNLCECGLEGISVYPYPVQAMTPSCGTYGEAITDKDIIKLLPNLLEAALKKGFEVPLKPNSGYIYCGSSKFTSFVIDLNAQPFKCALLQEKDANKIGSINKDGELVDINSEYYKWFSRDPTEIASCRKCKMLPLCNGGCAGSAVHKYGTYFINNCYENNISIFKRKLKLYLTYCLKS